MGQEWVIGKQLNKVNFRTRHPKLQCELDLNLWLVKLINKLNLYIKELEKGKENFIRLHLVNDFVNVLTKSRNKIISGIC